MATTQDFMNNNPFMEMMRNMDFAKGQDMWNNNFVNLWKNQSLQSDWAKQFSQYQEQFNKYSMDTLKIFKDMYSGNPNLMDQTTNNLNSMLSVIMKNMQVMSKAGQNIAENTQNIFRKKAEITQKRFSEIFSLIKEVSSSPNSEIVMSLQADYCRKSFEEMINDFKELTEMTTKSSLEAFEAVNKKLNESIANFQKTAEQTQVNKNNKK